MKAFKQTIEEITVKTEALEKRKATGKPVHADAIAMRKELKEGWRISGSGTQYRSVSRFGGVVRPFLIGRPDAAPVGKAPAQVCVEVGPRRLGCPQGLVERNGDVEVPVDGPVPELDLQDVSIRPVGGGGQAH